MEFLIPEKCSVLAYYDHPYWGKYAAITQNNFGKGTVTYIGGYPTLNLLEAVYKDVLKKTGMLTSDQLLHFPIITKQGINQYNKKIHYYFNYSGIGQTFNYPYPEGLNLIENKPVIGNQLLTLKAWDLIIIEEK
jgi:beta-galactosidase